MRIVLAPDKFKGSLTAAQACDAMRAGIARVDPKIEVDACPMADGGEGFVDALVRATAGRFITRRVTGPLPEMKVDATLGLLGDAGEAGPSGPGPTAVIEMSSASGLTLLRADQYDSLATTTFGTGELIRIAIEELGVQRILLGIGGSATNDAGIGCAQACGLPVLLEGGEPVADTEPLCGRDVERVVLVKYGRGDRLGGVEIVVACDVTNPLFGPNGAAHVFGPQKGATPQVVEQLDAALEQLATRTGKVQEANTPGAGAAGGLGFGLLAFFGARLERGTDIVIEATRLRERLRGADLCITGEGKIDAQSLAGKTIAGVAGACRDARVRCVAICGTKGDRADRVRALGISEVESIRSDGIDLDTALNNAADLLSATTEKLVRRHA